MTQARQSGFVIWPSIRDDHTRTFVIGAHGQAVSSAAHRIGTLSTLIVSMVGWMTRMTRID